MKKYTQEDIYEGFLLINKAGDTYKVQLNGKGATNVYLTGVTTSYNNSSYPMTSLLRLLNDLTYSEVITEPIINNSYSII